MPILASLNAKNRPKSFLNWNQCSFSSKGQFANSLLDSTSGSLAVLQRLLGLGRRGPCQRLVCTAKEGTVVRRWVSIQSSASRPSSRNIHPAAVEFLIGSDPGRQNFLHWARVAAADDSSSCTQRLPVQAASDWRLGRGQILFAAAVR